MPQFRAWFVRFGGLFRKRRNEADMAEEMREHIERLTERNIANGMSPNDARNASLREFGGTEQIKELAREQRVWRPADDFIQDLRFGARMLGRNPGFSALAILCLTIGIGINAVVFSWIEGMLFRPYPAVAHQERMFALAATARGASDFAPLSYPDLIDLRENCTALESVFVDRIIGTTLSVGDHAERASGALVSANYFDALGVRPILGRSFRPEEDSGRNAHPVTVISYQAWKDRYGGDPAIIGRTQMLNGVQHTIIGVTPENFHGTFIGYAFQFWVPVAMQETFDSTGYHLEDRNARWVEGYVFLKPGVTLTRAQQEISAIAKRLEDSFPESNRGRGIQLLPLSQTPFNAVRDMAPTLRMSLVVSIFVLLIACANVSNLLLVRALLRRHEMTVRLALGATRSRIAKQLFTEGLILSLFATLGGIALAWWCRDLIVFAAPVRTPGVIIDFPTRLDWRVLSLSVVLAIGATLIVGVAPAFQSRDLDLSRAMKTEAGNVLGGRARSRLRSALVVFQMCLSFILITGAALLLQSSRRLQNADPGFSTTNVVTSSADLFSAGYDAARAKIFHEELLRRARALAGVESVASARVRPFSYREYSSAEIAIDGYQPAPNEQLTADYNEVSEDYFRTLGIPLVAGREFLRTDTEDAPLVAIVNETMTAKYWPGRDSLGERFQVNGRWMQVVGVAKSCNYRTKLEQPIPFFYVPLRQNFSITSGLFLRTNQSVGAIATTLARELHALDPNIAPLDTVTMKEQVDRMSYPQRLAVRLLAVFGAIALLLAAIGLYGVVSYSVSQSTREIGLRMALGANASDLLRLVMSRGLALMCAGVLIGGILAAFITRMMTEMLYKVSPNDPVAFGTTILLMALVGAAACFFPARRAARLDPVRALRS